MSIDKSLFGRLKRLFSNNAVIRNVGGNQLKVVDTGRIQSLGNTNTNNLVDRYTRMYRSSTSFLYNATVDYPTLRKQLYDDYEAMDQESIVASAMDIIADECTLKNESSEVLQIVSSDERVQKILYNLFYDVLNIEFNLWPWIRNMCKYGDFYLHLKIAQDFGVYNVEPMLASEIIRKEGEDPKNPSECWFELDQNATSRTYQMMGKENPRLENYEMAHFRLLADANYLPYGRSFIEPARKSYKQYTLMKDAMLLQRIMRAPEKRVFYVDVGSIPPNEVEAYMQNFINKMKKTPYIDQSTGEYNLKFNIQNQLEDFYIPIRGQNQNTHIDTVKGLESNSIEDVNFLRDEMLAALKIPKAYFGFEKDLCISPETKIPLLDGRILTVLELINEFEKGIKNYVYSIDEYNKNIVPGEIEWVGYTRKNTKTIKVWLDNNQYIQCTPDHNFMMRDGSWKEAQYLIENDSLMPLYLKESTNKAINGYKQVYNPSTEKYEYVHRLVADFYEIKQPKKVIHHKDFNKLNNNPENLDCSMNFWEHSKYHANHNQNTLQKWIKINGASRKGFVKFKTGVCIGCKKEFDKTIIAISKRSNQYCSIECMRSNWKTKYKNIDFQFVVEQAQTCINFTELRNKIGIKDSTTFKKLLEHNNISKEDFIINFMIKAHKNPQFMSQFPKTNKFYKNHKVTKIEWIEELIDTCDLTIKNYHNFGTDAGVIIHNSGKATLASEDIRFARTIERIQRIIVSELTKIALVHLYVQGFEKEQLTNFKLSLTSPSIVQEQEKISLWKDKIALIKDIQDTGLLPSDWMYEKIFQMSEEEYEQHRDLVIEDKKRLFRIQQIENEGNDPAKTGKSFGTPHDLASLYGKGRSGMDEVPAGYNEDITSPPPELGRPEEKSSIYGTQQHHLGKDPIGSKEISIDEPGLDKNINPQFKNNSPLALEGDFVRHLTMLNNMKKHDKKITLFEGKTETSSLLNEDNIKLED